MTFKLEVTFHRPHPHQKLNHYSEEVVSIFRSLSQTIIPYRKLSAHVQNASRNNVGRNHGHHPDVSEDIQAHPHTRKGQELSGEAG